MKMKLLTRTLSLLLITSLTLFFANCGSEGGEKKPEQVQLEKLSGTWMLGTATLDGDENLAAEVIESGFSLTIGGTFNADSPDGPYTYAVTGTVTPSPWPASGDWTFDSTSGDSGLIVRDDNTGITYSIGSDGKLTLTFNYTGAGFDGARTSQVEGDWIFVLDPQ
jgi:hypothetical protein